MSTRSRMMSAGVALVRNLIAGAVFLGAGFALVQLAQRVNGDWRLAAIAEGCAAAIGLLVAFRLRAYVCLYLVAGQAVFVVAELVIHSVYGIRAAQGAPTHFAVMLAGTAGVLLGVFLSRRLDRSATPPVPMQVPAPPSVASGNRAA